MNGKSKLNSQRHQNQEVITPQHEELIKFVYECKFEKKEKKEGIKNLGTTVMVMSFCTLNS